MKNIKVKLQKMSRESHLILPAIVQGVDTDKTSKANKVGRGRYNNSHLFGICNV